MIFPIVVQIRNVVPKAAFLIAVILKITQGYHKEAQMVVFSMHEPFLEQMVRTTQLGLVGLKLLMKVFS